MDKELKFIIRKIEKVGEESGIDPVGLKIESAFSDLLLDDIDTD